MPRRALDRPLRIAQVAPLYESVPPTHYGGTERVVAALCDELVTDGHDVTLFAAGGSRTRATLVRSTPRPLRTHMSKRELAEVAPHAHLRMLADVCRRAGEFDIIHAHTDLWTLPFVDLVEPPTVVTLHGRLDVEAAMQTYSWYSNVPLVSISDHQRRPFAGTDVNWAATVYNGLPFDHYAGASGTPDYLAFVGRLTPEKGPERAIEIAHRAGLPLRVAAKVDPFDEEFFYGTIEPLFRKHRVDFVGEIDEDSKPDFFAGAVATLMPGDWPEPFGLVMIESLAAGTPVVALRRGSVPEVIEDGVSGFVCDDVTSMVESVGSIGTLSRERCRQRAAAFSASVMAERYLAVYESIIEERALLTAGAPGPS
ncbi:MAG: glycosyltransferase family 4 protein [Acidimicrobiia bacterium]